MTERQWELYRLSVVEGMPDSDYKTAVIAGIAHKLMRLDSIEASQSPFIEGAARTETDRMGERFLLPTRRNGRR
jgi:hypothetical protein